jgi:ABC-type sugar transport system substrate-binding protein
MVGKRESRPVRSSSSWALGVVLLGVLVLAGCGSSSSSSSSGSSGSGNTASKGTLCVGSLVGFAIVPDLMKIWQDTATKNNMQFTSAIASPEGDLNSASANIQSCVRKKAKVTVNITTPDKTQAAAINQTTSAGNFFVGQYAGAPIPGETESIGPNDPGMSKQLFDWAQQNIATGGKKPVVLALTTSAFPVVVDRIGSFVKLAQAAGWKVVGPTELRPADVATDATSKTAAALRSNPDINVILAYTDDVTAGAAPAVRDAGKSKQVKVLAWEGLEPTYAAMRAKTSLVAAVAGAPIDVMNDLQVWSVRKMLAGTFAKGSIWRCVGPLITPANVPPKGQPNKGGTCQEGTQVDSLGAVVGGTTYSAAQIKAMAASK